MKIPVQTSLGGYDIWLGRGALGRIAQCFDLQRRVLVVTDDGVPPQYAATVAAASKETVTVTVPQGERSKGMDTLQVLLRALAENAFTRTDCVVAVGGGVVGDMAGFAAAIYMRGIDFYNVPTTLLSQVDSSIGGKTAVDFMGYKNLVGAFYPPRGVLIDPDTLKTLPPRQIANGMAEAVKMSLTSDAELFSLFETADLSKDAVTEEIIHRSLLIKRAVVEADEREGGLRRVLNFGHTLAHAVESVCGMETYYHGECVAMGMLPMCAAPVRERLLRVLCKLNLPTELYGDKAALCDACRHDKKTAGDSITVVTVPEVGRFLMETISFAEFEQRIARGI